MGKRMRNVLPLPGSLSTAILPPCPSTIFETIARPRPTPVCLVVTKGLKMVSMLVGRNAAAPIDYAHFGLIAVLAGCAP